MARKWKEVIANLLTKAENPATTPEERDALIDKATELMVRFGIEEAQLRRNDNKPEEVTSKVFSVTNPQRLKKQTLMNGLANAFGCEAIVLFDKDKIQVFGFPSDLEKVETLYNSLIVQMFIGMASAVKPSHVHGKEFNSSFANGFVLTVLKRVRNVYLKVRNEEVRKTPGTDLVLRDRSLAVKSAFSSAFPQTMRRSGSKSTGNGYGQGAEAGLRANIGQGSLKAGRNQIGN
jgi:hypothetical protein